MRNKEKLYSIAKASAVVVLFLILVSSTSSASITEKQITTNMSDSQNPAIYGNKIVWQDDRNGNWDVYIYNLSTKNEIHTNNLSDQINPAIYENNVVWQDYRNGLSDIYLQNLTTNKQTRITTNNDDFPLKDYLPSIYGNKIAWNSHGTMCDCYWLDVYDISTKKFSEIGICAQGSPSIYGNKLVCYERYDMEQGIYVYNLSTLEGTMIVSNESEQGNPSIYGNRIVWEDYRNGNWDIYMYDLSTGKETQITTNKSDQQAPVIYGNSIVWQDNRNGNWDIYAYDLVTRQQIHTTNSSDQIDPAIYGNNVVWTDSRNGNPDIYMGTISYLPVAAFTASLTSGKAPLTVKFTDSSTDAYYWTWNFGDKTTSSDQSPTHKYTTAGKYTVTLTVKNAAGNNTMKKTDYITVN